MSPRNSPPGYNLLPSPTPIMSATIYQPNQNANHPSSNPEPPANNPMPEPHMMPEPSAIPESSTEATEETPAKDALKKEGSKTPRKAKKAEKKAGTRRVSKPSVKRSTMLVATMDESVCKKIANAASKRKKTGGDSAENVKQAPKKKPRRKFVRCQGQIKYMCSVCSKPDCGECSNCL